jgi:hypothetical protein
MIICNEKQKMRKKVFVVHLKVLSWDLSGITEENKENSQP